MKSKGAWFIIGVLGLCLVVMGFTGRLGDVLGAVFAPDEMSVTNG